METNSGCIDILFRKISLDRTIDCRFKGDSEAREVLSHSQISKKEFIKQANNYLEFRNYSEDEINNIYNKLVSSMNDMRELDNKSFKSVFNLLIQFTDSILTERDGEPYFRYEDTLRWRMLSHKLDQDIFTTSYFAYKDIMSSKQRSYFSWSTIIRSDNVRLHNMLKKGMAENHFHLKGSCPYFHLSWISLMNRITDRKDEFDSSEVNKKKLEMEIDCGEIDFAVLVKKAAVIRAFLFSKLNSINFLYDDISDKDNQLKTIELLLGNDSFLSYNTNEIQYELNCINHEFGHKFKETNIIDEGCIDYCIPKNISSKNINGNIFFYGERYFLYSMFKRIYSKDKRILKYADLFYEYLLIKSKFRSELIQVNDKVGFKNFSDYQSRKGKFLRRDKLLNDAIYYTAIETTLKDQNIKSLEARILPEESASKLASEIKRIDEIISKDIADFIYPARCDNALEVYDYDDEKKPRRQHRNKHFYVIQFPKMKDNIYTNFDENKNIICSLRPRHYQLRSYVKKSAIDIVNLRESMKPSIKRVLGIDACSNEIGCRPEVFSQAFRYLKSHTISSVYDNIIEEHKVPPLKATYHVGEDFLDLLDGLRAIDEALLFLNLEYGDRLGHALALGVDVDEWYKCKNYTLVLPKQDYLDNIVWILAKIREFNITNVDNLKNRLENEYDKLFQEIYKTNFYNKDMKNTYINHLTYYDAWLLRGDNPEKYTDGCFDDSSGISFWDRCKVNFKCDKDNLYRHNKNISYLYYTYHYNHNVKKKGAELCEVKISKDYINTVKQIQKNMQRIIAEKGIGIETNPSSNFLIGTFKRYEKHPITSFYNLGLTQDNEKINNCPQLFVSINTDDQGVFGTYLENEYALMAIALEKAKDELGNNLYNQAMIYDWLDRIRQMGLEQSFMVNKEI